MNKAMLLFNTIKYLKPKQIYYRLYYFVRARYRKVSGFKYEFSKRSNVTHLKLISSIENKYSKSNYNEFSFLNLSKKFTNEIDWNYSEYGKLWTYNLTYFEYLKDKKDINLIFDFIDNIENIKDGLEPFPISLRGMNWIKFLVEFDIQDKKIDNSLYAQYYILLDNLEYHLLGNHLLENGFSLLFGAYYFKDEKLYEKAKEILFVELDEQILDDGGHFELSPMYHKLMLFRILDCINLVKNNKYKNYELLNLLEDKASKMLGWLTNIKYKNGNIPLLNDSANKIAPTSNELFDYAGRLNIKPLNLKLKESGYRKIFTNKYECVVDVGNIGPTYIPGHAHADTFNFELYIDDKAFIVDSGLSTYNIGNIRDYERSIKSHNSVEINNQDSSEVWGSFRVANRAKVIELEEQGNYIKATHDGYYKKFGVYHTREWKFFDDKIVINDDLNQRTNAVFRLHFHPEISEFEINKRINTNNDYKINECFVAFEFNQRIKSKVLEIEFDKNLEVQIKI